MLASSSKRSISTLVSVSSCCRADSCERICARSRRMLSLICIIFTASSAYSLLFASRSITCMLSALLDTLACLRNGPSWRWISWSRSSRRSRFSWVVWSLRRARSLRLRCLRMPAASSINALLSAGVARRMESSLPCPTTTCICEPSPVSLRSSWISRSRTGEPLIAYSEPPLRKIVRLIVTSEYSISSVPSELSIVSDTCARPRGGRDEVPAKITSSIDVPRRVLTPCSPITQASASTIFDFPEPLGPTTAVMPGSNRRVVILANDLNPLIVSSLTYINFNYPQAFLFNYPLYRGQPACSRAREQGRQNPVHNNQCL